MLLISYIYFSVQTDAEYEELLTYRSIDHGNYTKVFDASQYSGDYPDNVDWRTKNAVTDVKDQVCHLTAVHRHTGV